MKLIILGGPGAGKGTQASQLCQFLSIPHISTGTILREAIAAHSDLGKQVQAYVAQGEFVPDKIMIELIRQRLQQPDSQQGWLLDGYPLTAFQAEELDFLLDSLEQRIDWAIWLEVPNAVLVERSLERSRSDDQPDVVHRRLELIQERTVPILDYYGYRKRLLKIDGNQSMEQVQQAIRQALGQGSTEA
ncbi:adenylate kinase [Leptolyngbya sp. CCY15150]|uniref:adenylate kinase n=1 Tax=Leptolyngbya sp. CCY15150 TaxID=2767772 RepID=UPI0019522BF3